MCDEQRQLVPLAPFIAIAERFDRMRVIDNAAIHAAFSHVRKHALSYSLVVNLSTQAIKSQFLSSVLRSSISN